MIIRDTRIRDWPALRKLVADAFPWMEHALVRYHICAYHNTTRICEMSGQLAGFCMHIPRPNSSMTWLELIGVSSKARGQGIGAVLIDDLESIASGQGHSKIGLTADDDNDPAISLYRRKGYEEIGQDNPRKSFVKQLDVEPTSSKPARHTAGPVRRLLNRALYYVIVA